MITGEDVVIADQVSIRLPEKIILGSHVAIDSYFYCTTRLEIGDYVHIGPHVSVIGGEDGLLKMGHFTNLAAGCRIICRTDAFLGEGLIGTGPVMPRQYRDKSICEPVIIEDLANVGTNVVVFPGVTIAQGSVIGAGAVLKNSTRPWTVYVGSPARPIKTRSHANMLEFAGKLGYPIKLLLD